jgi:nucleoside-triphosphatase THEP1
MLAIITGHRGSGKTALCRRLADRARATAWDVAGILSPAVLAGGEKVAIEALDLRSGERRLLARRRQGDSSASGLLTPAWAFDEATTAWGNSVLQRATPCDLLIVDELGVLEMERNLGWTAGLAAVSAGQYRYALVVVRPQLLDTALTRWPHAQVVDVMSDGDLAYLERLLSLT